MNVKNKQGQASVLVDLVASCDLPLGHANKIAAALQGASTLISNKGVKYDVQPELFTDPEFPDWKLIKITFRIDTDFEHIREEFYEPVFKAISSRL